MKYKAKKSYTKADKNFADLGSWQKHQTLIKGGTVELSNVPEKLKEHLTEMNPKKKEGN